MNLTRRGLFKLVAGAGAGIAALGSKAFAIGKGTSKVPASLSYPPSPKLPSGHRQWFCYDYQVTWIMFGIEKFNVKALARSECLLRIKRDLQHFGYREVRKSRSFVEMTRSDHDYRRFTMRILGQKI